MRTMTLSKCSILSISLSVSLFPFFLPLSFGAGLRYSRSVIHSPSIPSSPRTCHHRSPPTTVRSSSGPNHLINSSAARFAHESGMRTGQTAHQYGAGTCVFVLATWLQYSYIMGLKKGTNKDCKLSTVLRVPRAMKARTMWNASSYRMSSVASAVLSWWCSFSPLRFSCAKNVLITTFHYR